MRQNKYRAFARATKEMSPGAKKIPDLIEFFATQVDPKMLHAILNDLIFLQGTGLKDKKKKEIFEGDILKENFENEFGSFTEDVGVVEWCNAHAALEVVLRKGGDRQGFTIGSNSEVLGNIYENPDLVPHEHTLQTTESR